MMNTEPPDLWAVVPFAHTYAKQVNQKQATWGRLVKTLTTFTVHQDKLKVPAWSPAQYIAGQTRGSAGVRALSCLVLDYDSGVATIEDARRAWGSWPGILHTSWSHTEEHHKFRVIMPLWRPVPAADWPGVFAWAESWTRTTATPDKPMTPEEYRQAKWIKTIDPACKDPGRIFYVPAVRSEDWPRHAESWTPADRPGVFLGRFVPWQRHLDEYRERQARREARRAAPPPRRRRKASVQLRQELNQLRTCPSTRQALGISLGGKITGDQVRRVVCPRCRRPSVWWVINPESKTTASCDHLNSCGWYGQLEELQHTTMRRGGEDDAGAGAAAGVESNGSATRGRRGRSLG